MNAQSILEAEAGIRTPDGIADAVFYAWPDARHGWTVPDSAACDEPEAERAFAALPELFTTLR